MLLSDNKSLKNQKKIVILTSGPLDNQSCDSGFNSGYCHWCNKSNTTHCAHGHSAQNSARLPRSSLQDHLETHNSGLLSSIVTQMSCTGKMNTTAQTCVSPCWPAAVASLGTAVMILPGVPVVITLVVRIVIGVFMPALLVTPARK